MDMQHLEKAIALRTQLMNEAHNTALRLFNGFTEGWSGLSIELYGKTAVLLNQANPPEKLSPHLPAIIELLRHELPWLTSILLKNRRSRDPNLRRGRLLFGESLDNQVIENSTRYFLDLTSNLDTSLYVDTRNLRKWLKDNMTDKRVLNTFAYTGSLGIAALAGGATVVQTDRTPRFLEVAKASSRLNNFPVSNKHFLSGDFFRITASLRRQETLFDCVILDPPFFSTSQRGRVDLLTEYHRLVNKVRPLIAHNGWLVAINNAIFLSGREYIDSLNSLCDDGYLSIETLIPIPEDCIGLNRIAEQPYPTNPAPFNHPTKIAILRVQRKDNRIR